MESNEFWDMLKQICDMPASDFYHAFNCTYVLDILQYTPDEIKKKYEQYKQSLITLGSIIILEDNTPALVVQVLKSTYMCLCKDGKVHFIQQEKVRRNTDTKIDLLGLLKTETSTESE